MEHAVVFGGSGFLGIEITKVLMSHGINTRIAVRNLENPKLNLLKKLSGSFEIVYADVRNETSVELAVKGCQSAINAIGLYLQNRSETFEAVHELGARSIAHQCQVQGIQRLIHISGIGTDLYSNSPYVRARAKGEFVTKKVFPSTTILRPSAIFGIEDKLVNSIANILRVTPLFPLFGKGDLRLQPVFVGDVAEAVVRVLKRDDALGEIYELGGPTIYTYREFIQRIADFSRRKRPLIPVPILIWELLAFLTCFLPKPPITQDTLALVKQDNVVSETALSLSNLSVSPTPLESILPDYNF